MALAPGARLGHYAIEELIGEGGMGEVYRATDVRLNRSVAIKVLREHVSDQPEARARFQREAQTIAGLNHPHICVLHDVGRHEETDFLVMELLDGETLARRLLRGPLPLDQALRCAIEIADALDKAHRQGVTHRDLKPGNIMLTRSGVKLLDFGLAKLRQPQNVSSFSSAATQDAATAQGTILGTLQYMAPEQLEGEEADARTDIFALGAILYEMSTGRKAFEGKSQVSLIGAILKDTPKPVSELQPVAPAALDRLIAVCLSKDPDDRWQSVRDIWRELRWIEKAAPASAGVSVAGPETRSKPVRKRLPWIAAAVAFIAAAGMASLQIYQYLSRRTPALVRFIIPPPEKGTIEGYLDLGVGTTGGAISPDGLRFAFTGKDSTGKLLLWVRPMDSLVPEPVSGTEFALLPFWSPDSRSIGFFAQGKLKKVDILGGGPQTLGAADSPRGGAWNSDGTIIFAPSNAGGLSRISASGGDPKPVGKMLPGQTSLRLPSFLPDGRHFVYHASGSEETSGVYIGALDSEDAQRLLAADSTARYAPPGYLIFVRQGILFAQAFDVRKLQLAGEPLRLAESIPSNQYLSPISVSDTGILTFRTGATGLDVQLAWFDRGGKLIETVGPPGAYRGVDVSPDGKRVAVHGHEERGGDVWIFEPRGGSTRLTSDATQHNATPIWSPDGKSIVFASFRKGKWGLYRKLSDGTGAEELLIETDVLKEPMSWSPDGDSILYWVSDPKTRSDLWILPLTGDRKPWAFVNSTFSETHGTFSPDGKWIAYHADFTGRNEIYVQPFPKGARSQVSTTGGTRPRWRHDGKEIFFTTAAQVGVKMFAVSVNGSGATFEAGTAHELFDTGYVNLGHPGAGNEHPYAVSPDGQRFLIPRPVSAFRDNVAPSPITVVLNWTQMLRH